MDPITLAVLGLFGLFGGLFVAESRRKAAQRERIEQAYKFGPANVHGAARFANDEDIQKASLFKRIGIRIGFSLDSGRKLFINNSGHILTCAGARTGKFVTVLCEAILSLPRSYGLCIVDPKAEITCICAHYLKSRGRAVYVLNPFVIWLDRMKGLKLASFNPMSSLDPKSLSFHADCDKLADAICHEDGHSSDSHWINSARLLISGVIGALAKYGTPAEKSLIAVRTVITGSNGASLFEFCRESMKSPDPYIRQKLARFAAPGAEDNKELNGIVSTADTQTGFMANEAIAGSLKGGVDEISFRDLKRKPGTVISICLPLDQLPVTHKWFRILAATMISDTLKEGLRGKGAPVIAILDEVFQIGHLKILADAWGMAAGAASLQLWAVYQDVSQIMAQFKTGWQTMVQNSGTAMYFGVRDQQTAEFVAKQCGVTEVLSHSRSVSIDVRTGEPIVSDSATQSARPLLHPDQVRFGLQDDEMLMFCDGVPGVIRAKRKPYFKCRDLKGKYRDNPYFTKSGGWFSWLWK
jgi:type IV secretory pathway TraG/TraD family ATPase VirD4